MNGKIIGVSDFKEATELLLSGEADFHIERMYTLLLQEGQTKPLKYQKQSSFVVSKLEMPNKKNFNMNTADIYERQVFYEFEKITTEVKGPEGIY
jgi:hypothetical protein